MNYITKEGYDKLALELNYLWRTKRPEVTQAVSEAAALGDRSENAEYIYGKKQLREIDRRIYFLNKRLSELSIISTHPSDQTRIFFGAYVTLINENNSEERTIRIVGSDEFANDPCYISLRSPLARGLLGKTIDQTIALNLETGKVEYTILSIQYK